MNSIDDWAEWQKAYIHGLFVIWPPVGVRQLVNELRQKYDPDSQATIEAHITLTQPFLTRPSDQEWALLDQIVASFEPFDLSYGPVATFFPNPVIYLTIQPQERLLALRQALHDTGLFNLTLPYSDDFVPHMTIAEGLSERPVDELMLAEIRPQAPQGTFLLGEVVCVVPDVSFHFEIGARLPLAKNRA
jgi:2'-5' RNA ligase